MRGTYLTYLIAAALMVAGAAIAGGCLAVVDGLGRQDRVFGSGTITYVDLEGGFYGIVADDGSRYLPLNLPEEYRLDGLRITFVGELKGDTATIQQWGTPVEIIAVS